MREAPLLLFDHPSGTRDALQAALEAAGSRVVHITDDAHLEQALNEEGAALLIAALDLLPPKFPPSIGGEPRDEHTPGSRTELFASRLPPLVLLEDFGGSRPDEAALRALAFETVQRPAPTEQIVRVCERALESSELRRENRRLREEIGERFELGGLVSRDPRMRAVFGIIESVADSGASILIGGESGTGKTVLARCVHEHSPRAGEPFVVVNCGALPGSLLESELFGHARGAFTGAVRDRLGKFEAADGGTIFLDEIGTASPELQVKLLRVIEEGRFERVGETKTREVDVRVIAATNVELKQAVEEGVFRADLYYRLNVVGIEVPPLRRRLGDVPMLAQRFLTRARAAHRREVERFEPSALAALCAHPWPGNVRELENTIERAVLLSTDGTIDLHDLWPDERERPHLPADSETSLAGPHAPWGDLPVGPLKEALEVPERWLILRALRAHGGKRGQTAKALGINRTTLFNKMRKYHLEDFPTKMDSEDELPPQRDSFDRAG